jgi:glutamate-1-semialdehyde 2,1-aminomutase
MAVFDPRRGKPAVPHGGTFNANPVTMAAGLVSMRMLDEKAFHRLDELSARLRDGVTACFKEAGVGGSVTGAGSLFRIHPTDRELIDYRSTWPEPGDAERLSRIVRFLLDHGVLIAPTGLGCVSTVMAEPELEAFLEVFRAALQDAR